MGWWARLFGGVEAAPTPPPTWPELVAALYEEPPRQLPLPSTPPTDQECWELACLTAERLVARLERRLRAEGQRFHTARRFKDLDSGAVVEIHCMDPATLAEHHPEGLSSEICMGDYRGVFKILVQAGRLPNGRVARDQHALGHALTHDLDQAEGGPARRDDADHMWEGV